MKAFELIKYIKSELFLVNIYTSQVIPGNLFLEYKQALRLVPQISNLIVEYHLIVERAGEPVVENATTYQFQRRSPINQVANPDFVL